MKKCPQCGEESEDQFDSCWKCGTSFYPVPDPSTLEEEADPLKKLPEAENPGKYWLCSFLVPVGLLVLGFLIGIGLLQGRESDWYGGALLASYAVATILAALAALGFAAASILRAERHAIAALFPGMIGLGYLIFVVIALSKGLR